MSVALVLAAGSGERLRAGRPKALVQLGGRALYEWSLIALRRTRGIDAIVLALPDDAGAARGRDDAAAPDGAAVPAPDLALPAPDGAVAPHPPRTVAVAGGRTRSESVRGALRAAGPGDPVLVHDAARPLLTPALAREVIDALLADPSADAAIAAVPVTDTVKRVERSGAVRETLDRGELWAVQTPQVFRRAALERALDVPAEELARATDDAWLIERDGGRVIVVPSSEENLKVTTPLDLRVAELLLCERAAAGDPA